jgi:redox-sensitive bicupin YhaK (pirin superfamily)
VNHVLAPGRHAWVQVARGGVQLGTQALAAGDGAAVSDEPSLDIVATAPSEILVFDLA